MLPFWILLLTAFFKDSQSVPLAVIKADTNPVLEEVIEDDDSTTQTLERLSSAATCLVAGVEYTHGQQIYRPDPCEFCLCLDGEMFCWWQDCPPTLEGPCRERRAFSPCPINDEVSNHTNKNSPKPTSTTSGTSSSTVTATAISNETSSTITSSQNTSSGSTLKGIESSLETTENPSTTTAAPTPKVCVIMGREYQIGSQLPHDTGNCVECICGPDAQVTCSPNQCAPLGDDINDYRPPGPRQLDIF